MTERFAPSELDPRLDPHLDDVQLSMFIEGDADEEIYFHVAQCAHCRAYAEQLATQQNQLRALLHRSTCPPPDQLRDYAWDLLADDKAESLVRHHLSFCPHCTRDYFHDYYAGDTSGEDLFTVAARGGGLISFREAERVESGALGQPVGLRDGGPDESQPTLFQSAEGVLLVVTVRPDDAQVGNFVVEATLTGIKTDGLQINLWLTGHLVQTLLLDPVGDFRITGLRAGTYELILNGPTFKLRIPDLRVGNTPLDAHR